MALAIKVENLSKIYQIGQFGTGTISRDIERWIALALGKPDPFLKIGSVNKADNDIVHSLKDLNFEIEQGKTVGIIGKNGAGKSTLLKILSQITPPSTGRIRTKGRIASLLEVGTGFHPELTGIENIFLNGAILGMSKIEIKNKLDEIIDFSGVERYINTPVKRYSSGMYVRLAFAVAANLESEILIVDEVLAVGDAEFQKKCLGKMNDISKSEGRTILFVSHIMSSIKALCEESILLENGLLKLQADTETVLSNYLRPDDVENSHYHNSTNISNNIVYLLESYTRDEISKKSAFTSEEEINIVIKVNKLTTIRGVYGHLIIKNRDGIIILETDTLEQKNNIYDNDFVGVIDSLLTIPKRILKTGTYYVSLGLASSQADKFQIESLENFLSFEVSSNLTARDQKRTAVISLIPNWR